MLLLNYFRYQHKPVRPSNIEAVLLENPDVLECLAYGKHCDVNIEVPAALIVLRPESQTSLKDILVKANAKLPENSQLRGGLKSVKSLPRNHNGKLLRNKIDQALIVLDSVDF